MHKIITIAMFLTILCLLTTTNLYAGGNIPIKTPTPGKTPVSVKPNNPQQLKGNDDKPPACHSEPKGTDEDKCPGGGVVIFEVCPNKPDKFTGCKK